ACRQLASRARRTIAQDRRAARFHIGAAERRQVTEKFIAACTTGDLDGLLSLLDPDIAGEADVGGAVGTRAASGRDNVAPLLLQFLGPESGTTLLSLPAVDEVGVVALRGGRVVTVLTLSV